MSFYFGKDTEVRRSCSAQWKNVYYVFGGAKYKRQVSSMTGNRLERKATLSFDFSRGGCTVMNEETIVLCFHDAESDVCWQSNNPLGTFTKLPKSKHKHWGTRIASVNG